MTKQNTAGQLAVFTKPLTMKKMKNKTGIL